MELEIYSNDSDLETRIISEQRRAEESIELRKHYYGDTQNLDE